MKKYYIPVVDKSFYIYVGKKDWKKYYDKLKTFRSF